MALRQRHANRAALRRQLLAEFWPEDAATPPRCDLGLEIQISDELLQQMEERLILTEDIEDILARVADGPESRFYDSNDPNRQTYLACLRKQRVTYWLRYRQTGSQVQVLAVYSHRMDILS